METQQSDSVSAPVYERVIELPLERALLENPGQVLREMASWPAEDPRREYLYELFYRGSQRPVFIPCYSTPETGCAEPASYIFVPVKDGQTFVTPPRFVCPEAACTDIAKKRGKIDVVEFELSFFGLEDFLKEFPNDEDGKKFMRWLKRAKGLTQVGRRTREAAMTAFFKPVPNDEPNSEMQIPNA